MILVTGASGLIGSHLLDRLVRDEHKVVGTGRSLRNYISPRKVALIDHRDKIATDILFKNLKPEIVFHCAANVAQGKSIYNPVNSTENNTGIFINVLTSAIRHGMKRFVYISSNAVYGNIFTPYKEFNTPRPNDVYAVNKLACEQVLQIMAKV